MFDSVCKEIPVKKRKLLMTCFALEQNSLSDGDKRTPFFYLSFKAYSIILNRRENKSLSNYDLLKFIISKTSLRIYRQYDLSGEERTSRLNLNTSKIFNDDFSINTLLNDVDRSRILFDYLTIELEKEFNKLKKMYTGKCEICYSLEDKTREELKETLFFYNDILSMLKNEEKRLMEIFEIFKDKLNDFLAQSLSDLDDLESIYLLNFNIPIDDVIEYGNFFSIKEYKCKGRKLYNHLESIEFKNEEGKESIKISSKINKNTHAYLKKNTDIYFSHEEALKVGKDKINKLAKRFIKNGIVSF